MFEFEVGFRRFALHKSLVSRASPALTALMENGMRESQERYASIPDVDEITFARFAEFVYTGDYNTPQPIRRQEALKPSQSFETTQGKENMHRMDAQEVAAEPEPLPEPVYDVVDVPQVSEEHIDADIWASSVLSAKDKKKKKRRESAIVVRDDRPSSKLPSFAFDVVIVTPLPTTSSITHYGDIGRNDYTAVFFCHAKLYVLAEKYGVEHLKSLSRDRLNKSFINYEQASEPSADIPGLLRYVFEHTPERQAWDADEQTIKSPRALPRDMLQDICVRFAANNTETLVLSPAFHSLLRDGGSFVEMYFESVTERLT